MSRRGWRVVDTATGAPVTVEAFVSERDAEAWLERRREEVRRGLRWAHVVERWEVWEE